MPENPTRIKYVTFAVVMPRFKGGRYVEQSRIDPDQKPKQGFAMGTEENLRLLLPDNKKLAGIVDYPLEISDLECVERQEFLRRMAARKNQSLETVARELQITRGHAISKAWYFGDF